MLLFTFCLSNSSEVACWKADRVSSNFLMESCEFLQSNIVSTSFVYVYKIHTLIAREVFEMGFQKGFL
jgi:hypothetical protein